MNNERDDVVVVMQPWLASTLVFILVWGAVDILIAVGRWFV